MANETTVIEVPGDRSLHCNDWRSYHVLIWVHCIEVVQNRKTGPRGLDLDQNGGLPKS